MTGLVATGALITAIWNNQPTLSWTAPPPTDSSRFLLLAYTEL